MEAVRVLIEKGTLIEAADKLRIRAHKPSYTHTNKHLPAQSSLMLRIAI